MRTWRICARPSDADEQSLRETLAGVDYRYDPVYHQFIPITSKEV